MFAGVSKSNKGYKKERLLPFYICFSPCQTFHLDLAVLIICHATRTGRSIYLATLFINSLCLRILNILYRWDIWQMLAGCSSVASKIQMLISFHNLASTAQICTQKILFWITVVFDINTKHTHSCPRLLFPPLHGILLSDSGHNTLLGLPL